MFAKKQIFHLGIRLSFAHQNCFAINTIMTCLTQEKLFDMDICDRKKTRALQKHLQSIKSNALSLKSTHTHIMYFPAHFVRSYAMMCWPSPAEKYVCHFDQS